MFVLPFVFVFLTSVMSDQQTLTKDLWPQTWQWHNYVDVWHTGGFATWWRNTILYATVGTALTLVSSIPVAYALAHFRFRGRNLAMMVVVATMMLPPQVVIVPMYLFWAKQLHLSGTLWPLIIPLAFGDAFSIFLLRQFLLTVPREYIEAARIDGCSDLGAMLRIVLPLSRPAIVAVAPVPVLLPVERLLRAADLHEREPRGVDLELWTGVVQERAPHQLEPHHGRDPAGDGSGDRGVLPGAESIHRRCHAHGGQGMKIAVVGGGSTYTPELVDGIGRMQEALPVDELVLIDPAEDRLALVGGLGRRMLQRHDHPGVLTTTSDLDAGVAGADAVLLQLRVGGQAARGQDETWPLECGCVGQETTGAGGLAKALRTVPVVLDIASRVAEGEPGRVDRRLHQPGRHRHPGAPRGRAQGGGAVQRGHRLPAQVRRHAGRRAGAGAARPRRAQPPDLGAARARRRPGPAAGAARRAPRGDRRRDSSSRAWLLQQLGVVPSYYLRYFYAHDEVVRELKASPSRAAQVAEIEQELLRLYADERLDTKPELLTQRGGAFYSEAAVALCAQPARQLDRGGGAGGERPQR